MLQIEVVAPTNVRGKRRQPVSLGVHNVEVLTGDLVDVGRLSAPGAASICRTGDRHLSPLCWRLVGVTATSERPAQQHTAPISTQRGVP
jgi:hypothetical protein